MMDEQIQIEYQRLRPEIDSDLPLPQYMTAQSAGMDICAAVKEHIYIEPKDIAIVPTGFAVSLPSGFEAQIRPRSGLAAKHGITLINSPGTIDADYRGEIFIAIINLGKKNYRISRGDRIAQMVINKIHQAKIIVVEQLAQSQRNSGGFGHTGK